MGIHLYNGHVIIFDKFCDVTCPIEIWRVSPLNKDFFFFFMLSLASCIKMGTIN